MDMYGLYQKGRLPQ